jgi:glutamate carboxypeptidase
VSPADLRDRLAGDLDRLSADIVALAEINSGTFNIDGVNRVGERLATMADRLAPTSIEQLDIDPIAVVGADGVTSTADVGQALRITKRPDAEFRICLFGHLDTVFPADSMFQKVAVNGTRLHGPGVADCKGGLVLATEVLAHLDRVDWGHNIGWELLVLSNEEVGSANSEHLLAQAAASAQLGLGFEPSLPSGGVAAARKGSSNVHTIVHGLAAHAGRAYDEGRSAINELARLVTRLEGLNARDGVTVNCGRISGGGSLNVVPDLAVGSYNLRATSPADQAWLEAHIEAAHSEANLDVDVVWTSKRPPKERTAALDLMLADVEAAAASLGLTIAGEDTGGACDGNNLAAHGLVNVDSLGIFGGAIHSPNEFADVDSIPGRAAVVADVIHRAYRRHQS